MSELTTLPTELYQPILFHLFDDRRTLASVCSASSLLRAEAEPLLYTMLVDIDLASQLLLHQTIITVSRLAEMVQEYRLKDSWKFYKKGLENGRVKGSVDALIANFWTCVTDMLRAFTGLKSLFIICTTSSAIASSKLLTGCNFQLLSFAWTASYFDHLPSFLQTQKRLVHLSVLWDEDIPPPILPELSNLTTLVAQAGFNTVRLLLPGLAIRHLCWCPDLDDPKPHQLSDVISQSPGLAEAFARLESLCIIGGYLGEPPIEALGPFIPNVKILELRGKSAYSYGSTAHKICFLRSLMIFPDKVDPNLQSRRDIVGELFDSNKHLDQVLLCIVPYSSSPTGKRPERWRRPTSADETPDILGYAEATGAHASYDTSGSLDMPLWLYP
ncbi:hypothetical protein DL96DRAFT_1710046 [Flagelloscypha sp. PMI_526]|nr:hypothetical protein DL96DRAFT_1710046 [Flagelloscypha sp. PMI_526]